MKDIFEGVILCSKCGNRMEKGMLIRDGFKLRYVYCPKCKIKLWHPADMQEYKHFKDLKKREFKVKLRIVGNSYAVTLPREIINFIKDIEKEFNIRAHEEVKLIMNEMGKLNLVFENLENKLKKLIR